MRQSGGSWTDHFLDVEQIPAAGLNPATLPSLRYDFIVAFAAGRAAHPANFPQIDPAKNQDHTREWPGFIPWAITEYYAKVKSSFAYLKAFEENGTPEEIANAKANAIYVMGVMGHYVGDAAQPLHTTTRHDGWFGNNPNGYTTKPGIHSWIDSGFIAKVGITRADLLPRARPANLITVEPRPDHRDPVFVAVMDYLLAQHAKVETIYQLDRDGKLRADGGDTSEGRALIERQLLNGGQMLGSLWLTAWRNAPPDTYLRGELLKRKLAAAAK